jgi:subtilisin-like proprotein convertase family protein
LSERFLGRRKRLALIFSSALLALGVTAGSASAATQTFTDGHVVIPDDQPGRPYPATVNVSGVAGNVQKVTATLHDFAHSCPDDVSVLLQAPGGAHSILFGQGVAGCSSTEVVDATFDQSAPQPVTDPFVSGTYQPTLGTPDPFSPPAPGGPYQADLNAFNGPASTANGAWKLFVEDQVSGDAGGLGSWSLAITAPFNTTTVGAPTLNKKKGTAQVPVTVADAGQLTLSGKGVKTASAKESKAVAGPGTVTLTVKPKGKTASKLNSTGSAKVKVKITFTPNGGTSSVKTLKIKLKKNLG